MRLKPTVLTCVSSASLCRFADGKHSHRHGNRRKDAYPQPDMAVPAAIPGFAVSSTELRQSGLSLTRQGHGLVLHYCLQTAASPVHIGSVSMRYAVCYPAHLRCQVIRSGTSHHRFQTKLYCTTKWCDAFDSAVTAVGWQPTCSNIFFLCRTVFMAGLAATQQQCGTYGMPGITQPLGSNALVGSSPTGVFGE